MGIEINETNADTLYHVIIDDNSISCIWGLDDEEDRCFGDLDWRLKGVLGGLYILGYHVYCTEHQML